MPSAYDPGIEDVVDFAQVDTPAIINSLLADAGYVPDWDENLDHQVTLEDEHELEVAQAAPPDDDELSTSSEDIVGTYQEYIRHTVSTSDSALDGDLSDADLLEYYLQHSTPEQTALHALSLRFFMKRNII